MATQRDREPGTQTERGGEAKKRRRRHGSSSANDKRKNAQVRVNRKMKDAQVKVNGDTGQTPPTGLQAFTDEQLAAELESRGFEVWKWPREKDWKQ